LTTVIVPSTGNGCLFVQQGPGTTPGYAALDDRRSNSGPLQEGVYGTPRLVTAGGVANVACADFMVTQRAAGANMSVDVNMPPGAFAYVQGDTIDGQGLYTVPGHASNINETIAGSDPTNPRIDQIVLEVQDNVLDASAGNDARTRVVQGTATAGATLANRSGAAALPGSALLLADVLVGAAATTLGNAVIRDRRKWARGAFDRIGRSAAYTTTSTTPVAIDSTNLSIRVECSGLPIRLRFLGLANDVTVGGNILFGFFMDGAGIDSTTTIAQLVGATSSYATVAVEYVAIPTAGSHVFQPTWFVAAGTGSTPSGVPLMFSVEELVRQNAVNNAVTSG
jgi:hypothetical protein